jgi:hypothetical protein
LSVWQTGPAGRAVSRGNPQWRAEFVAILPDLTEDELQLNWRQRIHAHSIDEFRDGTSPAHQELIDILKPLARK